jgi:nucleotide-binding universal stress UspA family protein
MKILIATDGSPCSAEAVASVAARPWPAGTRVRVVSAVEPPMVYTTEGWALPPTYYEDLERALSERAEAALGDARKALAAGAGGFEVETAILRGSPKHAILDETEDWGPDLVVVGSHGRTGLERLLLGSVSHAVATHAKCSVEIVRCKPAAAAG